MRQVTAEYKEKRLQYRLHLEQQSRAVNGKVVCALCGLSSYVYDLHEIFSRQMCGSQATLEELPLPLHALICRSCNQNNGKVSADGTTGRSLLLDHSRKLWGDTKFFTEIDKFLSDHKFFFAEYISIEHTSTE